MNIDELNLNGTTDNQASPNAGLIYKEPVQAAAPVAQPVAPVLSSASVSPVNTVDHPNAGLIFKKPVPEVQPVAPVTQVAPATTVAPVASVAPVQPSVVEHPNAGLIFKDIPTESAAPVQENAHPNAGLIINEASQAPAPVTQSASSQVGTHQTFNTAPTLNFETPVELQNLPTIDETVNQTPAVAAAPVVEQPVSMPETAPVSTVEEAVPLPVADSTPVVDTNLPPEVAPTELNQNEVVVVNTTKRKSISNFIVVVLALGLVAFVFYIDEAIAFFNENVLHKTDIVVQTPVSTDNSVDGFIKVDDPESSFVYDKIRFYNVTKSGNNKIIINYVSDKYYKNVDEMGLFVELYNSDKELLYKSQILPTTNAIDNSAVGSITVSTNDIVYPKAYFAKIVTYSESEKISTSQLTCTYHDNNEDYLREDKNIYYFQNNNLVSYEVNMKVEPLHNNKNTTSAKNRIKKENEKAKKFEIQTNYTEGSSIKYTVDLNTVKEGFTLTYKKDATPLMIKLGETEKKWICE